MLSGYIPTSQILQLFGMFTYHSTAKEKMRLQVLNHAGKEFPIMGTSELILQYNPEVLDYPELEATYREMRSVGMIRPTWHYVGGKYHPINFTLLIEDSYSGPPHSTTDPMGNIVYNFFENLNDVINWLYSLAMPVTAWLKPPFVRVILGPYMRTGIITNVAPSAKALYPDGTPRLVEVNLTLQPDVIIVTADQSVFEVDK